MPDKTRSYRMQRRAESQLQTRLRITESAVTLHGTIGPSRTSISAVAAHAGVRRSPASLDRLGGGLGGAPTVGVEAVVLGRSGEQQQRFAECVELELLVDPVADYVASPRIAGELE